ncbi:MAG: hypothetical protein WCC64_01175 [Aliidongia sp.]
MAALSDEIARLAALRLGAEFDPALPALVEACLQPGEAPQQFGDGLNAAIALATLVVLATQTGWTIYHDLTKDAAPVASVVERRLRIELPHDVRLSAAQRDRVITVVVDEIVKTSNR